MVFNIRHAAFLAGVLIFTLAAGAAAEPVSNDQRRQLYGSVAIQPGVYKIRAMHSSMCLGMTDRDVPYLGQWPCQGGNEIENSTRLRIMPRPSGGYTIQIERYIFGEFCATVARDVIVGAKAVDVRRCDGGDTDARCEEAGARDQVFRFRRAGSGAYEIHYIPDEENAPDNCFDVRDGSMDQGAEAILFDCNEQNNQRFELVYQDAPGEGGWEAQCLHHQGWVLAPDGWRRAVAVAGVDLPGADASHQATANDQGQDCAQRCAADTGCRSFTWVRPGAQSLPDIDPASAICYLKSAVPEPQGNPDTASGVVRR